MAEAVRRLLAIWSAVTPHGTDSATTEMLLAGWLSRWPYRRIRFGLEQAVHRLVAEGAAQVPDERRALDFARGVIERAHEHEWKPGAERPDKAPLVPVAKVGPVRSRGGRPAYGEAEDAHINDQWRAAEAAGAFKPLEETDEPDPF